MQPLTILVIEKDNQYINAIKECAENTVYGSEVLLAQTLNEYCYILENSHPDIIFSEYDVGDINGLDVLTYAQRSFDHPKVVFTTGAFVDEQLASQTILSKASAFILKKSTKTFIENVQKLMLTASIEKPEPSHTAGHSAQYNAIQMYIRRTKSTLEQARKDNQDHINSYRQLKNDIDRLHTTTAV